MTRDLYEVDNTRYLATMPWMMTCTDGVSTMPTQDITHPRAYGGFPKKIRQFVNEDQAIDLSFAIRSMTGLAADFLRLPDRGYVREGMIADIAIIDPNRFTDRATYENPLRLSEGVIHLLVNGTFAIQDEVITDDRAGKEIRHNSP